MSLVIISIFIVLLAGCTKEAQAEVDGEAKNLEDLKTMVSDTKEELNELDGKIESKKSEMSEIETEFQNRESEFSELSKLAENKETVETDLSESESTLETLNAEIESAESELSKLEESIVKAKDSPVELMAGQWIVGEDVPAARYQASGSSNFVVYDSYGSLEVNTILSDGDYVFFAEDGYIIDSSAAAKLTPVE